MPRYIALLRGINLGRSRKVPMAQLRALLERQGFSRVRTLLQSGNAVFTAEGQERALAAQLEAALEREFGFHIDVVLRTRNALAQLIELNPMRAAAERAPSKFLVVFASKKLPSRVLAAIEPEQYLPDEVRLNGRELYAHFPDGLGRSKLALVLLNAKFAEGVILTSRNWNTVRKLLALADVE